jgi:CheY-like chemotaxis protein/anti-sigma regulatory factor (Ser/Thr protein kinase)
MTSFANLVVKLLELRISHKKVENADTSKSAFFASMSHEIRTPMNGIIGAATLLKNSDPNDTQSRYIDTILSSGRMLLEIIDELLDFAKIENNSLPLHITSFNLRRACEQQVDLLQTIAQEKNIELSLTFDDNIPNIVKLDETRIKQILSNLIGNAIKFTDPNGEVHLSLTQLEHDRLKIEVRDNGAGIAEKELDKIFTAYQQILEHRKKTNKTGTGLGLAITKHLVERMNGTIDVESKVGVGTKFTIMLPYEIGTKEEEILSGYDTPNLKDINLDAHVLLVEDVLTNQFIISNILEKLGCHVDIADNGKVALDKIQQVEYDLVFMDCNMPEMDGYEATRLIRKLTNIKQPRIIALTAHAFKEDEEKCLKAGMDTFMTKPLEINKVIQILNE